MWSKFYSLHKSRNILKYSYKWYKKKGKSLNSDQLNELENDLEKLDQAVLRKDRKEADFFARKIEDFGKVRFKKSFFEYSSEIIIAVVFALLIALLVRQVWFEPYEIPTGSMRPTFKEQDHVTVTKTAFGINFPMKTEHLYFDPNLVQRTSMIIFSGDQLPLSDTDSKIFWIIPYKKRYIKRCAGKPGDVLYFYGGKIYGIDRENNLISEFLDSPWLEKIENIPFLNFEGKIVYTKPHEFRLYQMNQPVGRFSFSQDGEILNGEIFNGKEWVKDRPVAQKFPQHKEIQTYSDLWGIRNYAMTRILSKEEIKKYTDIELKDLEDAQLYLELRHHPSLTYPKPLLLREKRGGTIPFLIPLKSVIPLQERHLDALMSNMYTARFVVKNGYATRYSEEGTHFSSNNPHFSNIPDGTYEFYYGKAYQVGWGAITYELPKEHPLYSRNPEHIQKLYNLGIEMDTAFQPHSFMQYYYPHRYGYFRDGDLYLLGAPIFKKGDPLLTDFLKREMNKEKSSTVQQPYIGFKDYGPPLKNGKVDHEFIRQFGLKIPEQNYLALGDNHAMSADSRVFGFVPQANLQGAPCYIVWPPGNRWGAPPQKPYPMFNVPRLIIWGIVLFIALSWFLIHRRKIQQPLFKKVQ